MNNPIKITEEGIEAGLLAAGEIALPTGTTVKCAHVNKAYYDQDKVNEMQDENNMWLLFKSKPLPKFDPATVEVPVPSV